MKQVSLSKGKAILHILAGLAGFILIQMAGSLGMLIPFPPLAYLATAVLTIGLFFGFIKLYTQKVMGLPLQQFRVRKPTGMAPWVVCAIALPLLVSGALVLLIPGNFAVAPLSAAQRADRILRAVLLPCLIAGITEELLFRGFIMRILEVCWGRKAAIWAPSLLFGALHIMNMEQFGVVDVLQLMVAGTSVGILFSVIAMRSGSIWPGALVHGLWNLWIIGGILDIGVQPAATSVITYTLTSPSVLLTGGAFGVESALPAILGYWLAIAAAMVIPRLQKKTT